jgi:hypothetical protein
MGVVEGFLTIVKGPLKSIEKKSNLCQFLFTSSILVTRCGSGKFLPSPAGAQEY